MQVDAVFQRNRSREPYAIGHDEPSAAFLLQGRNGLAECFGVECHAIAYAAKVRQRNLIVRQSEHSDGSYLRRQVLVIPFIVASPAVATRHQGDE